MTEAIQTRCGRWRLAEGLLRHPHLRIAPSGEDGLTLSGRISVSHPGPAQVPISDAYEIEIHVPPEFPAELPTAREIGGRIPEDFHKLEGNFLCLGAPTEL